jgi:hypothetical protein
MVVGSPTVLNHNVRFWEVRKLMNTVKEESSSSLSNSDDDQQLGNPINNKDYYDMTLWGPVVCENSGKQMAVEVVGTGRRLVRALQKKGTLQKGEDGRRVSSCFCFRDPHVEL